MSRLPTGSKAPEVIANLWAAEIQARRLSKQEVWRRMQAYDDEKKARMIRVLKERLRGVT